jgi:hypothetical protein
MTQTIPKLKIGYPPCTQSCDFRTIMPIKPRSEKLLDRGRSASKSNNLANFVLHYDCTTMFPRQTRCWHAPTTMLRWPMPTIDRVYCVYTTLPLRYSSSHYDATQTEKTVRRYCYDVVLVVRFWYDFGDDIYIFGFKKYFSFTSKLQTLTGVLILIWLIWLYFMKNKYWLKLKLHRLWTGGGAEGGQEDTGYGDGWLQFGQYDTLMRELRMEDTTISDYDWSNSSAIKINCYLTDRGMIVVRSW